MKTEETIRKLTPESTINQIITSDQNAATLLRSIGLKPDQYLDQTLRSACQQLQWNEEELLAWIKQHGYQPEESKNKLEELENNNDITELCDRMKGFIQSCIYKQLTEITNDLPRVRLVHGNQYTWLKNIEWHFKTLNELLERYFMLEINTLFPLAKELSRQEESILYGKAKNLERAMAVLKEDRGKISRKMDKIREFSNGFQHPAGACSTLRILNKNMADLDQQITTYFSVEVDHIFPIIEKHLQLK